MWKVISIVNLMMAFLLTINVDTGEKKLYLDAGDIEVEPKLDDFYREGKM